MAKVTPEIIDQICERIASGESQRAVCRDMKLDWSSVNKLLRSDDYYPHYARAMAARAERYAEEIVELADDLVGDPDPRSRQVRIDARKWIACKLLPKVYGDKLTLEPSESFAQLLLEARERGRRLMELMPPDDDVIEVDASLDQPLTKGP